VPYLWIPVFRLEPVCTTLGGGNSRRKPRADASFSNAKTGIYRYGTLDATGTDTAEGYQDYLTAFPDGPNAAEVHSRIAVHQQRESRVKPWLDALLKSGDTDALFPLQVSKTAGAFPPPFYPVYLGQESQGDLEHYVTVWFRNSHFTGHVARAKTIVFVRTGQIQVGCYMLPGGADSGMAAERQFLSVCLVDADDLDRRRVVEAKSEPAERIRGNAGIGGTYTIDGVRHEGSKYVGALYSEVLHQLVSEAELEVRAGAHR
jgi:hypothetical protein